LTENRFETNKKDGFFLYDIEYDTGTYLNWIFLISSHEEFSFYPEPPLAKEAKKHFKFKFMIVNSKKIQFATLNATQDKLFFSDLKDVKNDYA
jgi:hypothetical protein